MSFKFLHRIRKAKTFGFLPHGEAIDGLKATFAHVVSTPREVGRAARSRIFSRCYQDTGLKCLFKPDCVVEISETENPFHPYLRRSMSKQRVAMLPSKAQQQAIEARLNFALGAETYDRLFLGFICGDVDNDTVDIFVQNEDTAAIVCTGYSWHVAVVVESVMKKSIKCVNVLPKNLSQMR
ncbi:MAG TPA: hypothetical protein VEN78_38930 [Bradyrhizobium sp.]|nr:hypothetical protein [Bradyrhizobium sp.]